MERAVLLRSISCSSVACSRFFIRSSQKTVHPASAAFCTTPFSFSAPLKRHRFVQNPARRSVLRRQWRAVSSSPSSLHLKRCFPSLSPRAISTSSKQASQGKNDGLLQDICAKFEVLSEPSVCLLGNEGRY